MTRPACRLVATFPSLAALVLLAAALAFPLTAAAQCPSMVWNDEFDGTALDSSKWTLQTGDGCAEGICGWGNNELQTYQAENVSVSNGTLTLTAREQRVRNKNYTSGRIRTLGKGDWTFGRFEARLRLPQGQGIWPAFWMLPTDEVFGGWPSSGEIDVMEMIGHLPATVYGTLHFGTSPQTAQNDGTTFELADGIFADGFHDFAVEREAGVIRWMVDDVLFFERTAADIAPANWPFDERFHFLLNVAVGGNFPGNPDATTVFPQTLTADWVRVWDGNFPHLSGPRQVAHQAAGTVYTVGNAFAGSTFTWTVPAGAAIASGQGTSTVTVDWGTSGGELSVDLTSGCGNETLSTDVVVDPPYVRASSFENFDDPAEITFNLATGTLTLVANPDTSGLNPSATSGDYTRNAGELFDVLFYDVATIADAGAYESDAKRFSMDVRSAAPAGTVVLVQLEDSSTATPTNYPAGRHSRYEATTTGAASWERLTFDHLDSPDPSTADGAVDSLIVLFAPNTSDGSLYTWDNFDAYAVDDGGVPATTMHVASISEGSQSAGQGNKRATATVTMVDDQGAPVVGATVSGDFTGDFNEPASGTTAADGTVTLVTTGSAKGSIAFTFCVTDATHANLSYAPGDNVQNCS